MSVLERLLDDAQHQLTVCNACRYCEGYCAVFPAAERRSLFTEGDLAYLSNLCHDCRACYQACMYAPPHEFGVNIPELMSAARVASYERYARPRWLRRAFERGPLVLLALTLASVLAILALYAGIAGLGSLFEARTGPGAFYDVVAHTAMLVPALLASAFVAMVAVAGLVAFWRDGGAGLRELAAPRVWLGALRDIATARWMRGGGGECYYPDEERPSASRVAWHSLVAYGFLATFLATVSAFVQETLLGIEPPYPFLSVPVVLGLGGGIAVTAASVALIVLKRRSARALAADADAGLAYAFLASLLMVSVTGLALLFLRDTAAMGTLLLLHLATVLVLYLTAPYGKLMHAVYRAAAVLRYAHERHEGADSA